LIKILFLLFSLFFFYGCTYNDNIRYDLDITQDQRSTLKGQIIIDSNSTKDVYLVLLKYKDGDIKNPKNYKLVDFAIHQLNDTNYDFTIIEGYYRIFAYQNLEKLKDEKYAHIFESKTLFIKNNSTTTLNILLKQTPQKVKLPNPLISSTKDESVLKNFANIKQTTLEDKIFQRENASEGLWNPSSFIKQVGSGIFMLEPFDENKKAILFIHGMKGTPTDFTHIINSLDRSKYLPMVYYYPTGLNLNYSVSGLKRALDKLHNQYKIKELHIIAHSMGGLVAKALINNYKKIKVNKLITISTPWNGHKFAELGKESIKYFVPSFGNMIPQSSFIKNNISLPLPEHLKHYLIFGYKGNSSLILESSNDGTIELSSQLYEDVEKNAYKVYGFNETHISILKSKSLFEYLQVVLKE